jgi:hypothetical protein
MELMLSLVALFADNLALFVDAAVLFSLLLGAAAVHWLREL